MTAAPRRTPSGHQMKLRHLWRVALATASLGGAMTFTACNADQSLAVANVNSPDVGRIFATPDGIEAILRSGFSQIFGATHQFPVPADATGNITPATQAFSFENYASFAAYGLTLRASIPRIPIDNNKGNATAKDNFRDFQQLSLRARTLANAITSLDSLIARGLTLGSPAQNLRARSFGFFNLGLANAELALMYDSVGVTHPGMSLTTVEIAPLVSYQAAMVEALKQLDSAVTIANAARTATGTNGFPLPTTWLRTSGGATSLDDYVRIIRSAKARFRAGVARSPAERAAVDWSAVVADAGNGITKDVRLDLDNGAGWGNSWLSGMALYTGWSMMTPYIIGMADTTSGYANWLTVERGSRQPFLIITPDKRFPQGATRAAQQAASPAADAVLPTVYFRNRPTGDDTPGEAWGNSNYDFVRFRHYRQQSDIGPWIWMAQTESEMLQAEGLIRLGRAAEAVPLINRTRVANGLPPFPAGATAADRAPAQPGGSATSCVPRTPTGPNGAVECGSLLEAMKWEKRLETIFTGYAQWFIDSRGWNDLPYETPTMWPVPYQEMDARLQPYYNSQTGDPKWQARGNTYGFGIGSR
jgi:hypothetical protein